MKNVLITGVSSGLGQALWDYYRAKGWQVYGIGRHRPAEATDGVFEACDLERFDTIGPALERLLAGVEALDLVLLNAGTLGPIDDISAVSDEALRRVMDVNMWANKAVLDTLIRRKTAVTQVIGISSGASKSGSRGWSGYALSKAAFNMLLRLYAREMEGTHVTALAPGLIETAMLGHLLYDQQDTKRFTSIQRLRDSKAEGMVMSPAATAEAIEAVREKLAAFESGSFVDLRTLN